MRKMLLIAFSALITLTSPVFADDDPALRAFNNGNYSSALDIWKKAATKGDAEAQYRVGHMYFTGKGVDRNLQEAKKWYDAAAKQGHATAYYQLKKLETAN